MKKDSDPKYQSQSLNRYANEKRQSSHRQNRQVEIQHKVSQRPSEYNSKQSKRESPKQNKIKVDKKTLQNRMLITALAMSACLVGTLLVGLMYRYSVISELKYDINTINREIDEIGNQKKEIQVKLEQSNRSDVIEKIAMEQLGMIYPSEENIVYIEID